MITAEQRRKNAEQIDMKHDKRVKQAVRLHNRGEKIGVIAEQMGLPESTIRFYIREFGFVR